MLATTSPSRILCIPRGRLPGNNDPERCSKLVPLKSDLQNPDCFRLAERCMNRRKNLCATHCGSVIVGGLGVVGFSNQLLQSARFLLGYGHELGYSKITSILSNW